MPPPGVETVKPSRFRPKLHWELLVCGAAGHELVGLDVAHLEEADPVYARMIDGVRWHRCLRCDSWLPLPGPAAPGREHPPARAEIDLPLRGRPLRDKIILRLIAINRALHFFVLGLIAVLIFLFSSNRETFRARAYKIIADLQPGTSTGAAKHGLLHEIDRAFSLQSGTLHLVGAVFAVYALVEGVEAVGLWYQRRWAEYLTLLVTASLLPLEVYELAHRLSPLKIVTIVINVAVVVYLLFAKRLFGVRGGAAAEERVREADVGWGALERAGPEAVSQPAG
jgi:uncharacterized membrane protein (DUF2068 family)